MDGCIKLNSYGNYALSAAIWLAWKSESEIAADSAYYHLKEVAEDQRIPASFLCKIMQILVKRGILDSKKGVGGGFKLARSPQEISILEIIESCEGSYLRSFCIFYPARRCPGKECALFCPIRKIEEQMRGKLNHISLQELACHLENHSERISGDSQKIFLRKDARRVRARSRGKKAFVEPFSPRSLA